MDSQPSLPSWEHRSCTHPPEIIKSERRVAKVKEVPANEFLNPFDPNLDQEYLFNIASGIPVDQGLADGILATKERGEDLCNTFLQNCILSIKENIHDPIKHQEKALFKNSGKKVTVKKNGKEKIIEANQEITETLLALSAKHDKLINFETTLQYFLFPGPLSLAHPDGTLKCINESSKSYKTSTEEDKSPPKQNAAFVVGLIGFDSSNFTSPSYLCQAGYDISQSLAKELSKNIIADTYRENSLKNNERDGREVKVIIRSASSRTLRKFTEFLKNMDNKTRLIGLIKDELIKNPQDMLDLLSSEMIYSCEGRGYSYRGNTTIK